MQNHPITSKLLCPASLQPCPPLTPGNSSSVILRLCNFISQMYRWNHTTGTFLRLAFSARHSSPWDPSLSFHVPVLCLWVASHCPDTSQFLNNLPLKEQLGYFDFSKKRSYRPSYAGFCMNWSFHVFGVIAQEYNRWVLWLNTCCYERKC